MNSEWWEVERYEHRFINFVGWESGWRRMRSPYVISPTPVYGMCEHNARREHEKAWRDGDITRLVRVRRDAEGRETREVCNGN